MRAAVLLLLLLLGGCATRELPPAFVYTLQPPPPQARPAAEARGPVLKLMPLRGTRPFATTRMLYTEQGIDQNAFAFSRWSDAPTRMLQPLLAEALSRSGLFRAVLPAGSSGRGDLVLEGTLLDFSLHLDGKGPRGVMEIRFVLSDRRGRKVLASRLFRAEVPAEKAGAEATARTLNEAAGRISRALVRWLAEETGRSAQAGAPSADRSSRRTPGR